MRRTVFPLGLYLVFFMAEALAAQDRNDPTYLLLDRTYRINVTARIVGTDEELVWNMETSYITISGRTVTIPLKGNNLVVLVHVTPYKEKSGEVLLVAQGQVWYTPTGSKEVKYLSTLKSIPMQLGEKLLFFPLGKDAGTAAPAGGEKSVSDVIVVQVQILPYQDNPEK